MKKSLVSAHLLLLCLLSCAWLRAATAPAGFAETLVAGGVNSGLNPTRMEFSPDGRLFVLEKPGRVRVVTLGMVPVMSPTPLLDISAHVDVQGERGLLGLAFDPDFAAGSRYLYLYYTVKTPLHNRISRFPIAADGSITATESILLELPALVSTNHNGGAIAFGSDKKLYVAVGENTVSANAQNKDILLGKMLRLNKDGTFPTDNPFYTTTTANRSAVWCMGLRNPFSFAVQPIIGGAMYINDVGAASWEEINQVSKGANFGWPGIEGKRTTQTPPADYQDPIYAYSHGAGHSICGGAFYNPLTPGPDAFPAKWTGRYFFGDYGLGSGTSGWIKSIDPANPAIATVFLASVGRPIDVKVAADGGLWYLSRGAGGASLAENTSTNDGELYRVRSVVVLPATKLAFGTQPASVGAGVVLPAITVQIQNANGGLVGGATNAVTIAFGANPVAAVLSGTTTVAAVGGVATFSDLRIDRAGTGFTLAASATGLSSATSSAFNILGQVVTPTISPNGGTFTGPVWVQLTTGTAGATIRYTTDDTIPTTTSAVYTAPFQLTATATVKAIALKTGMATSGVASVVQTITGTRPYGVTYRPVITGLNLPTSPAQAPTTLSATGVFTDLATLTPRAGIIPFTVNCPLWSDNAEKARWVALPGNATVGFNATGEWIWPAGTVLIKHFALRTDERTLGVTRRLETRILVVNPAGGSSYGLTYRWNAAGTDANLLTSDGLQEDIVITGSTGSTRTQRWNYPSQAQCMECHNTGAGTVLGPKTRQLNGDVTYSGGVTDNQLRTWNYLRMFSADISETAIPSLARMVPVTDAAATLENRVRSYLDANCASCHRPGSTVPWDARYDTPLARQGIIHGAVNQHISSDPNVYPRERVIVPRDQQVSVLYQRMISVDASAQMPPLGRNVVHTAATQTVLTWLNQLPNGTGLRGEYWSNQTGTFNGLPTVTRIDPQVNFAWGSGAPATGVTTDHFTVRWTGTIVPASSETYTFTVTSDDGARLWIANQLIIDRFVNQAATAWSGTIALTAGQAVPIRLEYFDSTTSASASLKWQSPSNPSEIVPMYRLFPAPQASPVATSIAVTPGTSDAVIGGTLSYAAVVKDQFGSPMSPQPAITWSVSGGGTISTAGVYSPTSVGPFTVTAVAAGLTGIATVTVVPSFAVKVNFQPLASPTVAGYWPDGGRVFADRGNGYTFGWNVDITATARDRNLNANQLLDTLLHMQKVATPNAAWELQVPDGIGTYHVFAVAGDSGNYPSTVTTPRSYKILAEGKELVSGVPTTTVRHFATPDGGIRVIVSDGRLTISSAPGAIDNKIMYIEVIRVPSGAN